MSSLILEQCFSPKKIPRPSKTKNFREKIYEHVNYFTLIFFLDSLSNLDSMLDNATITVFSARVRFLLSFLINNNEEKLHSAKYVVGNGYIYFIAYFNFFYLFGIDVQNSSIFTELKECFKGVSLMNLQKFSCRLSGMESGSKLREFIRKAEYKARSVGNNK